MSDQVQEVDWMKSLKGALKTAGYVDHPEHPQYALQEPLSHNGPHVVLGAWISPDGTQWVHVEQNTAPPPDDIYNAAGERIVQPAETYPPLVVIENARGGRVAVSPLDLAAFAGALKGAENDHNFTDGKTYDNTEKPGGAR